MRWGWRDGLDLHSVAKVTLQTRPSAGDTELFPHEVQEQWSHLAPTMLQAVHPQDVCLLPVVEVLREFGYRPRKFQNVAVSRGTLRIRTWDEDEEQHRRQHFDPLVDDDGLKVAGINRWAGLSEGEPGIAEPQGTAPQCVAGHAALHGCLQRMVTGSHTRC